MNEDDNNVHPWIEPDLEARVVAWVLGEASAFEAGELERLVAENPELALFKRRIEAAHRLTAAAAKPDQPSLRLATDRRRKLLEVLDSGARPAASPKVSVFPRRPAWLNAALLGRVAACLLVAGVGVAILSSITQFNAPGEGLETATRFAATPGADFPAPNAAPASPPLAEAKPQSSLPRGEMVAHTAGNRANSPERLDGVIFGGSIVGPLDENNVSKHKEEAPATSAPPAARQAEGTALSAAELAKAVAMDSAAPQSKSKSESVSVSDDSAAAMMTRSAGGVPAFGMASSAPTPEKSMELAAAAPAPVDFILPPPGESALSLAPEAEPQKKPASENIGADLMEAPTVTTTSGSRATINVLREFQYPAQSDTTASEGKAVDQLLHEADNFYQTGRYDLAAKRSEQALSVDKSNIAARRLLKKVNTSREDYAGAAHNATRSRLTASVDQAWELPVGEFAGGKDVSRVDQTKRKLADIRIPAINFREATVREAIDYLETRSAALDPNEPDPKRRGVDIDLKLDPAMEETRITLQFTDIPVGDALRYVAAAAGLKTKVDAGSVTIVPMSDATNVLTTKEYKVSPEFIHGLSANGSSGVDGKFNAKKFFETMGVSFPAGASANYLASSAKIIVRNTEENLDLVDTLVDVDTLTSPKEAAAISPPELKAGDQPFSTFSLHVADVSFLLAKDALDRGEKPDPGRIRPEEFYNAVDYGDPAPAANEPISCRIEQSAHPFRQQRNLVRIAMKVASRGRVASQPLRLTILLDTSGSMEREDRAASVRRALASLAPLLGPQDRVTLVGFARQPRLLAGQLPGNEAAKLVEIAGRTPSEGGTNLEAALDLAGELAFGQRDPAAQNRIVLLTDGAANLGDAKPAELARKIESLRQRGIAFDACGVGANGLNDEVLEALTRKGDGRYYFLNRPDDADAGFAKQLAGALRPAAENVKVQVKFNPARVGKYRLIGFEEHRLKKKDFRNDRVDAAELSAEEAAAALYQVEPLPDGEGELGEVFVRFRDAATGAMVERSWTLPYDAQAPAFDRASSSMQLAGVAALLAEKLRGNDEIDLEKLAPVVNALRGVYPQQQRVQDLVRMFGQMAR